MHLMFMWARDEGIDFQKFASAVDCIAVTDWACPTVVRVPADNLTIRLSSLMISSGLRNALNGNAVKIMIVLYLSIAPYSGMNHLLPRRAQFISCKTN